MQRRDFMSAVAALAATNWEEADFDIENVEEWDSLDGIASVMVEEFTPQEFMSSGRGPMTAWQVDEEDVEESGIEVFYHSDGVALTIEGGTGEEIRNGALATISDEQARQMGAALYQAGEELRLRREAEGRNDE